MSFNHLGSLLDQRIKQLGADQQVKAVRIVEQANLALQGLFGEDVLGHTNAVSYKYKKVYIASLHAVMKSELMLQKENLIAAINEHFGNDVVQEIQLMI